MALDPGDPPGQAQQLAVEPPAIVSVQQLPFGICAERTGFAVPLSAMQYSLYPAAQ
jgi:hypothetical protein